MKKLKILAKWCFFYPQKLALVEDVRLYFCTQLEISQIGIIRVNLASSSKFCFEQIRKIRSGSNSLKFDPIRINSNKGPNCWSA